jgi:hypothetical protein
MVHVTVFRDRFVRSWPQLDAEKPLRSDDRAFVVSLASMLERDFSTDVHFTAYHSPNRTRLNSEAPSDETPVELTCAIFDVDAPGHAEMLILDPWRKQLRERVVELAKAHPNPYHYETKGGSRILYRLAEPFVIRSRDDAAEWSQRYAVAVAYLKRRFGIASDIACKDWTRCFRAPRATRTEGGKPENWPVWGDLSNIGTLKIEATSTDVVAADEASNAFVRGRNIDLGTPSVVGDGLFYWLFRYRGDLGRDAPLGGWIVRCPNRSQHGNNSDGTRSTIVYPARGEGELGKIHCYHAHCEGIRARDWLGFFSDYEIDAARHAAGISSRGAAHAS